VEISKWKMRRRQEDDGWKTDVREREMVSQTRKDAELEEKMTRGSVQNRGHLIGDNRTLEMAPFLGFLGISCRSTRQLFSSPCCPLLVALFVSIPFPSFDSFKRIYSRTSFSVQCICAKQHRGLIIGVGKSLPFWNEETCPRSCDWCCWRNRICSSLPHCKVFNTVTNSYHAEINN
jgi:hypothetical protein